MQALDGEPALSWLLQEDPENPGVRYFALRDLLDRPLDDAELQDAQTQVMRTGPVLVILAAQHFGGCWLDSSHLYAGKYRSSTWQVKFLADLGADPRDPRVQFACRYLLDHVLSARTEEVRLALAEGARFLLSRDPADADYPFTERVSSTCFKFGFPLAYWSDVLELAEVLVKMGYGTDPRLERLFGLILIKACPQGQWKMENSINGKMWVDIEAKGRPSKWITLRALRVLRGAALVSFAN